MLILRQAIPFFLLLLATALPAQSVYISEAAPGNTVFYDEDEDNEDWLELHNPGPQAVDLTGWTLTDDPANPDKWPLPDYELVAGEYLRIWASGKNRDQVAFARTIIDRGAVFRYLVPTEAPGDWTALNFNDNNWAQGPSGFGYSDDDDATELPDPTTAVFLRKTFTLERIEDVVGLVLQMDYDDGFAAYINGVEIGRANLWADRNEFDGLARREHEAIGERGFTPERFELPAEELPLRAGENVLAIQVHNLIPESSDLSAIPWLSVMFRKETGAGIAPPQYLRLEDRCPHTNFKLSSEGEELLLFGGAGTQVNSLVMGAVPVNRSFGRPTGAPSETAWFAVPTPGAANGEALSGRVTDPVTFSHPGGPTSPLSLSLSGSPADAIIRYTLDATEPNASSPVYSVPLTIDETTVVRARVFISGRLPGPVANRTYLIGSGHELPVVSLVTDPANFFDPVNGIYVRGDGFTNAYPYFGSNIWREWERPVHFSFFEPDGSLGIAQEMGAKIFGGFSRGLPQRSLSLFARNSYGEGKLDYLLFPDLPYEEFESIILRNSGNDWLRTMLRDAALTGLFAGTDLDFQAYRPTAAYINGNYWGIYNLREKVNEHFIASKRGLDEADINLLERFGEVIHGENAGYDELIVFLRSNTLENTPEYNHVAGEIDIDNFILYNIAEIYFNNTDWPSNNIKYWKTDTGKWRWILFDVDFGFGLFSTSDYQLNSLERTLNITSNGAETQYFGNLLLRELVVNTNFRNRFVNQFADEMNRRFLPERIEARVAGLAASIRSEIPDHFDRWGGDADFWVSEVSRINDFGRLRPEAMKGHLLEVFELPAYHELTIANTTPERGYVLVNTLDVRDGAWRGDYFEEVPVPVIALAKAGYEFSHWEEGSTATTAAIDVSLTEALTLQPVFVESSDGITNPVINEINYKSPDDADSGDWVELFNPNPNEFDLTDWVLKDGNDDNFFVFPAGTRLSPNGYLVVGRSEARFRVVHPQVDAYVGDMDFGLSANGEEVRLFSPDGDLKDIVSYLPDAPWPAAANGNGPTLELRDSASDNALASNWRADRNGGSPGRDNNLTSRSGPEPESLKVSLRPNPFTNFAEISLDLLAGTEVSAKLYDVAGREVFVFTPRTVGAGRRRITAELGYLPPGVYVLQLTAASGERVSRRWVKR